MGKAAGVSILLNYVYKRGGGNKKPCFVRQSRCPKWEYDDDDDDDDTRLWPEKKREESRSPALSQRLDRHNQQRRGLFALSIKWKKGPRSFAF